MRLLCGYWVALATLVGGCGESVPGGGDEEPPLTECVANLDGQIDADELPMVPGIEVRYTRNSEPVDVDLDGMDDGTGGVLWDFSDGPTDVGATLELLAPDEAPHAELFPEMTYAAPLLVESPELLGYFHRGTSADGVDVLAMLGMATTDDVPPASRTVVVYDTPLVLYRFPLALADTWEQTVTYRDATTLGLPNQGVEHYTFVVDAAGTARLPGGIEVSDVLRVRVETEQILAVQVGEPAYETHQMLWIRPCFGELARAVSSEPDFAPVEEFRRYYP